MAGCASLATEAYWLAGWPPWLANEILARWESPLAQPGLARARECVPPKRKIIQFQKNHVLTVKHVAFAKFNFYYIKSL